MRVRLLLQVMLAASLLNAAELAAKDLRPPTLTGTYSDVCVHPESGDLLGTELSFIRSGDVTYVLMQPYEGEAGVPELLKVRSSGSRMYVHSEAAGDVLSLELRDEVLVGVWLDGQMGAPVQRRDTLVPARTVWGGAEPEYCREEAERERD